MQALSTGNEGPSKPKLEWIGQCHLAVAVSAESADETPSTGCTREERNLPMINQKKTSELIETSLIYLLSAAVAVGAFVLVWLVSLLLGSSQT